LSCKTAETYPIESVRRKEVSDQRLSARRGIASVVMPLNSHTFQLSFRTAPDPSGLRDWKSRNFKIWILAGIYPGEGPMCGNTAEILEHAFTPRKRDAPREIAKSSDVTSSTTRFAIWTRATGKKYGGLVTDQHNRLDMAKSLPGISHAQTRGQY
jgi:hypothetical protein